MPDAFIYDHVRTPRGRGKADGALHEVTALNLAAQALGRHQAAQRLDTALVDDVILGCVDPVGEAGGDIARAAALVAGYGNAVPGVQINRFCASGLDAVNFAAAQIMSGQHDMAIGGGVESMSRVGIGASGGAWPVDPSIALKSYFMPQGISADLIATKYGFSRDDVDAYAVESQKRAAVAWQEGYFGKSVMPVKDVNGMTILGARRAHAARHQHAVAGAAQAVVRADGRNGWFRRGRRAGASGSRGVEHVHHAGNSSGIVDGAAAVLIGSRDGRPAPPRLKPRAKIRAFANIGSDPAIMLTGPVDVTEESAQARQHDDRGHRPDRDQRGVRRRGAALTCRRSRSIPQGQRQRRRDRDGPSARRDRRDDPRHRARRTGAPRPRQPRWSRCASAPAWAPPRSSSGCERMPKIDVAKAEVRTTGRLSAAAPLGHRRARKGGARQCRGARRSSASTSHGSSRARRRRCVTGTSRKTNSSICSTASWC